MSSYKERIRDAMGGGDISTDRMRGLAKHLGVSYQAIKKLVDLDGASNTLSAENNSRAARYLGVSPDWLATGEGEIRATHPSSRGTEQKSDALLQALNVLSSAISNADELTRLSIEPLLSRLVQKPQESGTISRKLYEELKDRTVINARGETEFAGQLFDPFKEETKQSEQRDRTAAQGRRKSS